MENFRVPFAALILSLAALSIQCARATDTAPPDARLVKFFGGEAGYKLVSSSDKVEAYRVELPITKRGETVPGKKIDGYKILTGPLDVEAKPLAALRAAVLDPANYDWDIATACEFQPGVAIRFNGRATDGKPTHVDLVFCFVCGELETRQDGNVLATRFFGNHRAPFNAAMKQIFRKDAEIQQLDRPR
jgi:hypothetical protein